MSKEEIHGWSDFDQTEVAHWTEVISELKSKKENGMIKEYEMRSENGLPKNVLVSMENVEKSATESEDEKDEESEAESEMMDLEDPRNSDIFSVHDVEEDDDDEDNEEIDEESEPAQYEEDLTTIPVKLDAYDSKQEDGIFVIYDGQQPSVDDEEQGAANDANENESDEFDAHHENDEKNDHQEKEIHVEGFRKEPPRAETSGAPKKLLEPTRMSKETKKFIVQIMDGDEREQMFRSCFDGKYQPGSLVDIIDQRTGRTIVLGREEFVSMVEALPIEKKMKDITISHDVERALDNALQSAVAEEDRSTFLHAQINYDFLIDPRMKSTLDGAFDEAIDDVLAMTTETSQDPKVFFPVAEGPLQTPEALRKERFPSPGPMLTGHTQNRYEEPPPPPNWFGGSGRSPSKTNDQQPNGDALLESGRSNIFETRKKRSDVVAPQRSYSGDGAAAKDNQPSNMSSAMKPSYRRDRATKARYTRRENCCKKHLNIWIFLLVLMVIVLCCVGGGAYYYFLIYRV